MIETQMPCHLWTHKGRMLRRSPHSLSTEEDNYIWLYLQASIEAKAASSRSHGIEYHRCKIKGNTPYQAI